MRLSKEKNHEILVNVRREMVKNPYITIFELQDVLGKQYNHIFDKNFLGKLKNKVHRERAHRVSKILNYELAGFEDTIEELCASLWEIVDNEKSTFREKINAIREIRSAKSILLETMFNSGIFETNFNKPKTENTLSPENEELMTQALSYVFNPDRPTKHINPDENPENKV